MGVYLAIFFVCFAVAATSSGILIPLEFRLRQSHVTVFPWLSFSVRRIELHTAFESTRSIAFANPNLFACNAGADRFIMSTKHIRCVADRVPASARTRLVFRFPAGLILFATAIPMGVVLPATENVVNDPTKICGFLFCCCFMGFLAFVFLSLFWQIAVDETKQILDALGVDNAARADNHAVNRSSRKRVS